MNAQPRHPEEPEDAQLAKLYHESAAPEPSAEMDQAILAAARREVHARPRRVGPWLRKWRVPVSIAATLVVSASLVMVAVEEGGNRMDGSPPMAPAPARKEAVAPGTPATDDLAARGRSAATPEGSPGHRADAPSPIASKSSPKREPASEARPLLESPRAQPAAPPASLARPFPAAPPESDAAPRAEVEDRAAPRPEPPAPHTAETQRRDAPGGEVAGGLQARRERTKDGGTTAPGSSRPSLGVRGLTDAPLQGEGTDQRSASPDAIGRAAPSHPPKVTGPDAQAQERRAPASAATVSPPAAKRLAEPRPESRGAVLGRDLVDQPPEKWLERIEQLRRDDRHSDADELLGEFRRRFPAHPAAQRAPERQAYE